MDLMQNIIDAKEGVGLQEVGLNDQEERGGGRKTRRKARRGLFCGTALVKKRATRNRRSV
jgi:hypothetical protein